MQDVNKRIKKYQRQSSFIIWALLTISFSLLNQAACEKRNAHTIWWGTVWLFCLQYTTNLYWDTSWLPYNMQWVELLSGHHQSPTTIDSLFSHEKYIIIISHAKGHKSSNECKELVSGQLQVNQPLYSKQCEQWHVNGASYCRGVPSVSCSVKSDRNLVAPVYAGGLLPAWRKMSGDHSTSGWRKQI